jgi:histidine triad (HIT) family protein
VAECPFCKRIAAGEYDHDGYHTVTFEPLNPVTEGHRLVVPMEHVEHALENTEITGRTMEYAVAIARRLGIESCNLITSVGADATQTVSHLHIHIVPRRPDDGLLLPWTGQQIAVPS